MPRTERSRKASQLLAENGCIVKGHPLCWHSFTPEWLLDMSNPQILQTELQRIEREVSDFAGLNAIPGAENTLKTQKPKLAICNYNKSSDLWTVILQINEFVPECKFFMRHHDA